jgi:hypothetical protein
MLHCCLNIGAGSDAPSIILQTQYAAQPLLDVSRSSRGGILPLTGFAGDRPCTVGSDTPDGLRGGIPKVLICGYEEKARELSALRVVLAAM